MHASMLQAWCHLGSHLPRAASSSSCSSPSREPTTTTHQRTNAATPMHKTDGAPHATRWGLRLRKEQGAQPHCDATRHNTCRLATPATPSTMIACVQSGSCRQAATANPLHLHAPPGQRLTGHGQGHRSTMIGGPNKGVGDAAHAATITTAALNVEVAQTRGGLPLAPPPWL